MAPFHTRSGAISTREETRDYLFDMIAQFAQMARRSGETSVAIHLEAILAARRCELEHQPEKCEAVFGKS